MVRGLLRYEAMKVTGRVTKRDADFDIEIEITDDGEDSVFELLPDEACGEPEVEGIDDENQEPACEPPITPSP